VIEAADRKGDRSLSAKAYMRIGLCLEHLQKKPEAIQAYQKALQLNEIKGKDYDDVIAKLERRAVVLDELPDEIQKSICDHFYRKAEQVQNESPDKAIETYRRAVEVSRFLNQSERAGFAMSFMGDLYRRQERFEDALGTYAEVEKEFPNEAAVLAWNCMRIAETYRLLGRPAEAVKAYAALESEKFQKQVQPKLWARLWMGDAYRAMGDMERAKQVWADLAGTEENAPIPATLAAMLLEKGQAPSSQEPEDPFANDVAYFVAIRHSMAEDLESSVQWFRKCIELSYGYDWPRQLAEKELLKFPATERPDSPVRD
jgi:tetratricopeptide (TPR) repeat protein